MAKPIGPKKVHRYNRLHSGIDYHTPERYERLVP